MHEIENTIPDSSVVRPGVRDLLTHIREDAKKLAGLQVSLAQAELKQEGRRFALGMLLVALAIGTSVGTTVILGLSLVEGLQALSLSRGAALSSVSALMLALTAGCGWYSYQIFTSLDFVPRQTIETLKENAEWIANPTKSETK